MRNTIIKKTYAFLVYGHHLWTSTKLHRALCCLFRPDTDGTRVSKCGQLSQQTRRLDPMLFQCWSSAVGSGPILKQHWVKCSRLLGSTQVSVYTHPSATIIFSPADQGTFSKTAGQSQAYYNTWNWARGTYDVNHLHILTCERAVSRVSSVLLSLYLHHMVILGSQKKILMSWWF